MRTKEPRPIKTDYREVSRRSMQKDFERLNVGQNSGQAEEVKRVLSLTDKSNYGCYKRFFVGRLVKIQERASSGGYWVSFVNESDRKMLNSNAGFSEGKSRYLLDGVKFD